MNDRSTLTWDASTFVTSKGTLLESRASCQMKFYSTSKLCQYMKPELLCALQRIEGTVLLLFTLSSVTYSCKYSHVTCALKIIISFFLKKVNGVGGAQLHMNETGYLQSFFCVCKCRHKGQHTEFCCC